MSGMHQKAPTPSELIDEKGGSAAFARAIGADAGAVRMMKHRNKLPRSAWPEIQKAFDLGLDDMLAIEAGGSQGQDAAA